MEIINVPLLFVAAILAGSLNAVAGGGSFITFPSLIFTGVLPINANATNTVALWPGSGASVGAYRRELAAQERSLLICLIVTSFIGGMLGALLLLHTPETTFVHLIPYLLLIATLLLVFSRPLTNRFRKKNEQNTKRTRSVLLGVSLIQLVIAIYGGYFGGGIGILMLATLGLMGMKNIHEMNALKTLLGSSINGVAVITFVVARAVVWPEASLMVVGAIIGGYGTAYYARKMDPEWVRRFVILVGLGMTVYFFVRGG